MRSPPLQVSSDFGVWFLEPFARLPLPAWTICLLISLTITALFVAMELVYEPTIPVHRVLLASINPMSGVISAALLAGYIPTFVCGLAIASDRKFRELRPLWRNSDAEIDAIRAEKPFPKRRGFWLAGLGAVVIATPFNAYLRGVPLASFVFDGWDHHKLFEYGLILAIWTISSQALYLFYTTRNVGFYDRLSWDLDLLDLRSLAPFERERSTVALLGILWISIMSLTLLDDIQRSMAVPAGLLLFCLTWIVMLVTGQMRDVHSLIARLKQQELDRIAAAITGDRSALADSTLAQQAQTLSLTDLLAYRDAITSVSEWRVRSPTMFLRVLVLMLIPVGSWVGGALIERVVNSMLD